MILCYGGARNFQLRAAAPMVATTIGTIMIKIIMT
jgi:hypothetical protein